MKLIITMILSIGLLTGFHLSDKVIITHKNDLVELYELAEHNQMTITSWKVFERSHIGSERNHSDMNKKLQAIMNERSEYKWNLLVEEKNHHYVWNGTKSDNRNGIKESIKLKAYHATDSYKVSMTYEVIGSELKSDQLNWVKETFNGKKNVFYTMTGKMDLNNKSLQTVAENMIADVEGKTVEQLRETSFVSISAYSKHFDSELKTKDNKRLNLQMGLRTNEGTNEIDVTIGTPIITTEY